jgi:hypothetical protein
VLVGLIVAGPTAGAASSGCTPGELDVAMRAIPGSGAAGSVSYGVRLRNATTKTCTVSGRPGLVLLGRHGRRLPTRVVPDQRGTALAVLVTLMPGKVAVAQARFSPDVPGRGESTKGPCEPPAYRVRVSLPSPGAGTLAGPVRPATPVCEHGRIVLGLLHAG